MPEEESKADTMTQSHPDAGPYYPDTNPDGYLPLPGHICIIGSYDASPPWYRRLMARIAAWFVRCRPSNLL